MRARQRSRNLSQKFQPLSGISAPTRLIVVPILGPTILKPYSAFHLIRPVRLTTGCTSLIAASNLPAQIPSSFLGMMQDVAFPDSQNSPALSL